MMGLAKMAPDGWRYYAEEVGLGREDYFAGHGEEPGRWIGRGAEALGLMGEVTPEQLSGLFGEGCHPGTGTALGRPFLSEIGGKGARDGGKRGQGGAEQVAGYALSFSPPKSCRRGRPGVPPRPCSFHPPGPRRGHPSRHGRFRRGSLHTQDFTGA
jgi:hypothetical protein